MHRAHGTGRATGRRARRIGRAASGIGEGGNPPERGPAESREAAVPSNARAQFALRRAPCALYRSRMDIEAVIAEVQGTHKRKAAGRPAKPKGNVYSLTDEQLHEVLRRRRPGPPTPGGISPGGPKTDPNGTAPTPGPTPTPTLEAGSISVQFDANPQIGHDPDPWT